MPNGIVFSLLFLQLSNGDTNHLGFRPGLPGAQGGACPACVPAGLHLFASAAAGTSAAAPEHHSPCILTYILPSCTGVLLHAAFLHTARHCVMKAVDA